MFNNIEINISNFQSKYKSYDKYFFERIKEISKKPFNDPEKTGLNNIGKLCYEIDQFFRLRITKSLTLDSYSEQEIRESFHTKIPIKCCVTGYSEEIMYQIQDTNLYLCKTFVSCLRQAIESGFDIQMTKELKQ